jgi:uncharacterized protein YjbI with pentapeptide repeats
LAGTDFTNANLSNAAFNVNDLYSPRGANANNAIFAKTNLTGANLGFATLANAVFTGAVIKDANLGYATTRGFTASQLYSTASYAARDLSGVQFFNDDLTAWTFTNQDLSRASFASATLVSTNFRGAVLAGAVFDYYSILTGADFSGADLRGASGWSQATTAATAIVQNAILPDGSIQGLSLSTGEVLVIRNNPISVFVAASAAIDSSSTLEFLLEPSWTSPIGFEAGLTPSLSGTLGLEFADGVDPSMLVGDTFQLFNWSGPLPLGDQFSAIATTPGLSWDLSNLYTAGAVTLTAVPEPPTLMMATVGLGAAGLFARRRMRAAR